MGVSKSITQEYVISGVRVDMATPALDVSFDRLLDGVNVGGPTMRLDGEAFGAVFGVSGNAAKTRAADLADALYQAALDAGIITGVAA